MRTRSANLLLSAMLWLSIFIINALTACAAVTEPGDTQSPEILGAKDLVTYENEEPDYLASVSAADDSRETPSLEVNAGKVNLQKAGTYKAIYEARDASGNKAEAEITVTVLPRQADFASMAQVQQRIESVLNEIITDKMSTREKVGVIYDWVRLHIRYAGTSQKDDPYQAAYRALESGQGDCYSYFAVSKLLFDRLGIANLDVEKVPNSPDDSHHYWSLVSIDGGENYYHFDATPRLGGGDDFCLVTDAFLDEYSAAHNQSHNRDRTRYPATPK